MSRENINQKLLFMNYFIHCLKNYANFSGRARRKEYWMFVLFTAIFAILFAGLDNLLGTTISFNHPTEGLMKLPYGYFYFAFGLAMLVPGIAAIVRRFHDIGKSGWWYFIAFVPCIGIFPLIYFLVKAGDTGDNQFGPDPKA